MSNDVKCRRFPFNFSVVSICLDNLRLDNCLYREGEGLSMSIDNLQGMIMIVDVEEASQIAIQLINIVLRNYSSYCNNKSSDK